MRGPAGFSVNRNVSGGFANELDRLEVLLRGEEERVHVVEDVFLVRLLIEESALVLHVSRREILWQEDAMACYFAFYFGVVVAQYSGPSHGRFRPHALSRLSLRVVSLVNALSCRFCNAFYHACYGFLLI